MHFGGFPRRFKRQVDVVMDRAQSVSGVRVRGSANQTGDYLEVTGYGASAGLVFRINSSGNFRIGGRVGIGQEPTANFLDMLQANSSAMRLRFSNNDGAGQFYHNGGNLTIYNETSNGDINLETNTGTRITTKNDGRIGFSTTSFGGGTGALIALKDATVVPSTNPSGGGIAYSEAGALKWRGSSGTVTTIAPA